MTRFLSFDIHPDVRETNVTGSEHPRAIDGKEGRGKKLMSCEDREAIVGAVPGDKEREKVGAW